MKTLFAILTFYNLYTRIMSIYQVWKSDKVKKGYLIAFDLFLILLVLVINYLIFA